MSHVLFPEWVGAAGAYEPSCDLQRAPRCGGAASLPSVRKRGIAAGWRVAQYNLMMAIPNHAALAAAALAEREAGT